MLTDAFLDSKVLLKSCPGLMKSKSILYNLAPKFISCYEV